MMNAAVIEDQNSEYCTMYLRNKSLPSPPSGYLVRDNRVSPYREKKSTITNETVFEIL